MPARAQLGDASAASGLTGSPIATSPATAPSIATQTGVRPAAGEPLARAARAAAVSIPRSREQPGAPDDDRAGRRRGPRRRARRRPRTPSTGRKPSSSRWARATIAAPSGCSLPRSSGRREVEHLGRRSTPGAARSATTVGRPGGQRAGLVEDDRVDACARSSASPPRNRIPASAPRPVPTMIAVGVARPIAHGQATITTPMNAVRASVSRGSGPNSEPGRRTSGAAMTQDRRHEDLADPVGEPLDRRLRALGVLDEGDDPGERRVARRPASPGTRTYPVALSVAPKTSSPGPFATGHRPRRSASTRRPRTRRRRRRRRPGPGRRAGRGGGRRAGPPRPATDRSLAAGSTSRADVGLEADRAGGSRRSPGPSPAPRASGRAGRARG